MGTILLIEDNLELRRLIRDGLEAAGHRVRACADGDEGIARFREGPPDLVITDIVMKEKEGIGVLLEVRKEAPQIPVIVISAYKEYLSSARRLGATQTLLKPFRIPELLTCIENSMAR